MVKLVDRLRTPATSRVPATRTTVVRTWWTLTDPGRTALGEMRSSVLARDELITAALRPDERERLNDLLRTVLGEPAETPSLLSTEYLVTQVSTVSW